MVVRQQLIVAEYDIEELPEAGAGSATSLGGLSYAIYPTAARLEICPTGSRLEACSTTEPPLDAR